MLDKNEKVLTLTPLDHLDTENFNTDRWQARAAIMLGEESWFETIACLR